MAPCNITGSIPIWGLTKYSCSKCPVGSYLGTLGDWSCTSCPSGRYGDQSGLNTSSCSGACVVNSGATASLAPGQNTSTCGKSRVTRGWCAVCSTHTKGARLGTPNIAGSSCAAGRFPSGGDPCGGQCPIGKYAGPQTTSLTTCELCPAGRFVSFLCARTRRESFLFLIADEISVEQSHDLTIFPMIYPPPTPPTPPLYPDSATPQGSSTHNARESAW